MYLWGKKQIIMRLFMAVFFCVSQRSRISICIFLSAVFPLYMYGQIFPSDIEPAEEGAEFQLKRGFRNLILGIDFAAAQEYLRAEQYFLYRGEPDISLRLSDGQYLIDSGGKAFMERGLFQFHDGKLYIITLYLNQKELDYFQLFEQLSGRYGAPLVLNPELSRWEDSQTRIELEKPLTVRYLDVTVFQQKRAAD